MAESLIDMQDAFQAFMLGSGGARKTKGNKKKKTSDNSSSPPKPLVSPTPIAQKGSPSSPRHPQYYKQQQDYRAFQNLQQEWLETDETLYALVCSVADLRQRLFHTMQAHQQALQQRPIVDHSSNDSLWKSCGYRTRPSSSDDPKWLQADDFDMALDHCFLQHEKALQNIRKRVGQQSLAIDAMSRRLEFLLICDGEDSTLYLECLDRFRYVARELFRKQLLAQRLLASVEDTMLISLDSWEVARACQKMWRRKNVNKKT